MLVQHGPHWHNGVVLAPLGMVVLAIARAFILANFGQHSYPFRS